MILRFLQNVFLSSLKKLSQVLSRTSRQEIITTKHWNSGDLFQNFAIFYRKKPKNINSALVLRQKLKTTEKFEKTLEKSREIVELSFQSKITL